MTPDLDAPDRPHRVLVIGAYGLIGAGVVRQLTSDGYDVVGLVRDPITAKRVLPDVTCHTADLRSLTTAARWRSLLEDIGTVVNCSGALQDGPDDDLAAVHHHAIAALADACHAARVHLVQISAVGAHLDGSTAFMRSKARGDAAIVASGVSHQILRPGLVLAKQSYGGTAMIRMLAAFPVIQPIALPDAKMQVVSRDDLATVVSACVARQIPDGFAGDLISPEVYRLEDVLSKTRLWLGFAPAKSVVRVSPFVTRTISKLADSLATLGWRSPLRSTAIKVLVDGVVGQPEDLSAFGLKPMTSLEGILATMPAGSEDRLAARMALMTPIIIATLAIFWLASGVIGMLFSARAAETLTAAGWPFWLAQLSVLFWAMIDILIAAAFALRRFAKVACWAAILVSIFYLVASTVFVPGLWLDPLGPLVKVIPGIALGLVARIALDTR